MRKIFRGFLRVNKKLKKSNINNSIYTRNRSFTIAYLDIYLVI